MHGWLLLRPLQKVMNGRRAMNASDMAAANDMGQSGQAAPDRALADADQERELSDRDEVSLSNRIESLADCRHDWVGQCFAMHGVSSPCLPAK